MPLLAVELCWMVVAHWLSRALVEMGRALERACFGQSQFQWSSSEFSTAPSINDTVQAKMALSEVRKSLEQQFQMRLSWPILLELKAPPPLGWKASFYNPEGNLARHLVVELKGQNAHQIWVRPGMPRPRFKALVAHELTHAYQREANFLNQNLSLREGMARWVEFHMLQGSAEAKKLLELKQYTFGRAISSILDFEKRQGREATLQWLRQHP